MKHHLFTVLLIFMGIGILGTHIQKVSPPTTSLAAIKKERQPVEGIGVPFLGETEAGNHSLRELKDVLYGELENPSFLSVPGAKFQKELDDHINLYLCNNMIADVVAHSEEFIPPSDEEFVEYSLDGNGGGKEYVRKPYKGERVLRHTRSGIIWLSLYNWCPLLPMDKEKIKPCNSTEY